MEETIEVAALAIVLLVHCLPLLFLRKRREPLDPAWLARQAYPLKRDGPWRGSAMRKGGPR